MQLQLTISLLASNQIQAVRRCLDSLVPILMQIPSELIVVDTSGNTHIRDLALRYTSHVIPFCWCDDFSKARNTGLQEAQGEWFLYIDDDEWFEDPGEIIQFFTSGEYKNYNSAQYIVRSYNEWTGNSYTDAHLARMVRRTPETKFINGIHEFITPFREPFRNFSAYVHHYGYVKSAANAKTGRNLPLLEREAAEHATAHNYLQLCQEYMFAHQYAKAEAYAVKCLELKENGRKREKSWCVAYFPYMIYRQKEFRRAFETGTQILQHPCCTEIAAILVYATLVFICKNLVQHEEDTILYAKNYQHTISLMDAHTEQWRLQAIGELGEQAVKKLQPTVYLSGLSAAVHIKDSEATATFLRYIPWGSREAEGFYSSIQSMLGDPDKEDFLLSVFARLDIEDPFALIIKARAALREGSQDLAQKYCRAAAASRNDYVLCEAVFLFLQSQGRIPLEPWMDRIDLTLWKSISGYLAGRAELHQLSAWMTTAEEYLQGYPIQLLSIRISLHERLLTEGILEISDDELIQEMKQYCIWVRQFSEKVYSQHLQSSENIALMPGDFRFALQIEQAFRHMDEGNYPNALQDLREAIGTYPSLCGSIRRILSVIADAMDNPGCSSPEFQMLGAQVKSMVQDLLRKGCYTEALPLIQQLSELLPRDLEVVRLRQELWSQIGE